MRVAFIGNSADYSLRFLEELSQRSRNPADSVELAAVVCPQRFATRKAALAFAAKRSLGSVLDRRSTALPDAGSRLGGGPWSRVQRLARAAGAPVFWAPRVGDVREDVLALRPEIVIVAGLNQILKEPVLSAFPPIFNFHPSPLPAYRGGLPEFWQLDAGERESAVTAHRLERGVDTGLIVLQRRFEIEPWLDAEGFISRAADVGAEAMNTLIDHYPENARAAVPQEGGSHHPFPTERDRVVPHERPARRVYDRARTFGFRSPLLVHVPSAAWGRGEVTQATAGGAETRALRVYDPVVFDDHTVGAPGTVTIAMQGGVAITCNPGTILFRRYE